MSAAHISVILDRSGSMTSIADDIVEGLNGFLAEQRAEDGEARITVAQFDSHAPFELLIDKVPAREVTDLPRAAFQPRGGTPLYDAVGMMIGLADSEAGARREAGMDEEDQLMVIITDGLENASVEQTRESVFELISDRRDEGWSFIFLGADQDAFASGREMSISAANRAGWAKDRVGTAKMWKDTSYSALQYRRRESAARKIEADEVWQEDPDSGRSD